MVATGGNHSQIPRARKRRKQAKSVAAGCHRLPETFHGKQGVCRGLPPVAGGPLPAREGVDTHSCRLVISCRCSPGTSTGRNRSQCMPRGSCKILSRPRLRSRSRPPAPPARISQTLRVKGDRFEDPVRSPEHSLVLRRVLNASRTSRSIRNADFLPCETRVRP